jgi:hypothetical protein
MKGRRRRRSTSFKENIFTKKIQVGFSEFVSDFTTTGQSTILKTIIPQGWNAEQRMGWKD